MTNCQKAQKSIEEAIQLLREKSPESTLVERYFLLYEAWEKVEGLPQPCQMGKGLYEVLSKASLPIMEYDLLLGRFDDHVPDDAEQQKLNSLWETVPNANPIVMHNGGHTVLDWKKLVTVGIPGYITETELRIERAKAEFLIEKAKEEQAERANAGQATKAEQAEQEYQDTLDFLEGILWVHKSILMYIERYGEAAAEAGMTSCAEVCSRLVAGAPETFRDALQLILFVYNIYLIYAGRAIACLSTGRLDNILLSFYEKDLREGRLTEEDAGAFIDDFSAKMSLHLGRGEHQMAYLDENYVQTGWLRNPVYESPGYIILGGYSDVADQKTNPLTLLFAKHIHPELKNPIYVCRYTSDTYEELWDILCEKVQQNASVLLYNDETMLPAYEYIGVDRKDALDYSIHPCNWADISGGFASVGICGELLPEALNNVLHSGKSFTSMDEIYEEVKKRYAASIRPDFENYRQKFRSGRTVPDGRLMMEDCFESCVLETARGLRSGGAKYPALYVVLRYLATAVDMLSAIDTLVFRDKVYTLEQMVNAADEDFENTPDILKHCQKAPKYGNNDPIADGHACRLMNELLDTIDTEATNRDGQRDVYTLNVTICDTVHLRVGAAMPATVDGRRKGKPVSENLSPTVGYSQGITSLLNSVAKLPFERIHSGALNLRLNKSMVSGEAGIARIKALITSYFEQGGMQVQISITDAEELKAAQKTPEEYKDLLVRITGYSAIFVDMCEGAQNEFIRRQEL